MALPGKGIERRAFRARDFLEHGMSSPRVRLCEKALQPLKAWSVVVGFLNTEGKVIEG